MLKRFSANNFSIKVLDTGIDRETLCWTKRPLVGINTLPVPAAEVNGAIYQLAAFELTPETVILITLDNLTQALGLSIEMYGVETVTFTEWLEAYKKCAALSINFAAMPLNDNIRNNIDSSLSIFAAAARWNKTLIAWLEQKNVPWKTLRILAKMSDDNIGYITDYVKKCSPTLQSFRRFAEVVADFADKIADVIYDPTKHADITDRRLPLHKEIDSVLETVNRAVTAVNVDNWETSELHWKFTTKSVKQYDAILKLLAGTRKDVSALYKLLGEEDS